MNRTLWTLIFAMVLQLIAGGAWAWVDSHSENGRDASPALHCSEQMVHDDAPEQSGVQVCTYHCCAVGIGARLQVQIPALPQAQPISLPIWWASWRTRPDLPPPI